MAEMNIKLMESSTGTFYDVAFENQQDFSTYFSAIGAFPKPEPTEDGAGGGANSYVVTNINNLQPNGRYVLSTSNAPSLQKPTVASKLQEEYKNNRDADFEKTVRQVLTIRAAPIPSIINCKFLTDQQGS
jgi:hypothetical protein